MRPNVQRVTVSMLIFFFTIFYSCLGIAAVDVKRKFDIRTPMRDGVELSSNVWMPTQNGRFPLILMRTPYLEKEDADYANIAVYFAKNGYAFAIQDVRGRGDSDGIFDAYYQEGQDGFDTIEWMASQSWANGDVCMIGASYRAGSQWLAAKEKPAQLKCIAPISAPAFNSRFNDGGAIRLQNAIEWFNMTSGRQMHGRSLLEIDWNAVLRHRPMLTTDVLVGRNMPLFQEFLQPSLVAPERQELVSLTAEDYEQLNLPALHATGWFDHIQHGSLIHWKNMRRYSEKKDDQYLIIGPWSHSNLFLLGGPTNIGELRLSPDSVLDSRKLYLDFFDHYLKGQSRKPNWPRARIYVTGVNDWRNYASYPVPELKEIRYFLASGGRANSLHGDGALIAKHVSREQTDTYTFAPENPVMSNLDWRNDWASDRRSVERRDDVLVYTTNTLDQTIEVIGSVYVELYAVSDAKDTDFTAAVMDVYPDGRSVALGSQVPGVTRARYRNGYDREDLLVPGKVEKYRIELGDIAHAFLPGHRIRIDISSSAFPKLSVNPNTGNPIAIDTEPMQSTRQTILHGSEFPSALVLPTTATTGSTTK